MDDEERQHLEKLVREYQRRLRPLELRRAQQGSNTAPEVINEIEDIRSEIARIQARLNGQPAAPAPAQPPYGQINVSAPAPALAPPDLKRLRRQALAAFYTQKWEQVIALLSQLVTADPNDADARTKLARAQRERGWQLRYEEICELRERTSGRRCSARWTTWSAISQAIPTRRGCAPGPRPASAAKNTTTPR